MSTQILQLFFTTVHFLRFLEINKTRFLLEKIFHSIISDLNWLIEFQV